MMDNLNTEIAEWVAKAAGLVSKGDLPGHPFRGNQYSRFDNNAQDLAMQSRYLYREAGFGGEGGARENAKEHARIALEHRDIAENNRIEGNESLSELHTKAAEAHDIASMVSLKAAEAIASGSPYSRGLSEAAVARSGKASQASTDVADTERGMSGFSKSVGEIQKSDFPDARIPEGMDTDNEFTVASKDLMDNARAIITIHENAGMGKIKHLTSDDYQALAERHDELAKAHEMVALMLKEADPVRNIQSISAHGDAMGAHEDASKASEMMTDTHYDHQWDGHHGQMRPAHGANHNKVWRKAHRAFLMSQMAFNRTNFDTGVVVKSADDLGNLVLMAEKAAEDGDLYRKQSADAYAAGDTDKAGSLSILAMDAYKMAHNFLRTATATITQPAQ